MDQTHRAHITGLLDQWGKGSEQALDELIPLVYDELRVIARRHMRGQPANHTFQTTDLIHEAYVKISGQDEAKWRNREHFFAVAAQAMRHILVDHARSRNADKRGGGRHNQITLDEAAVVSENHYAEMLILDEALDKLCAFDERKCRVIELKFFGGLKENEIAGVLGISTDTVQRDLRFSRSWLLREMSD